MVPPGIMDSDSHAVADNSPKVQKSIGNCHESWAQLRVASWLELRVDLRSILSQLCLLASLEMSLIHRGVVLKCDMYRYLLVQFMAIPTYDLS